MKARLIKARLHLNLTHAQQEKKSRLAEVSSSCRPSKEGQTDLCSQGKRHTGRKKGFQNLHSELYMYVQYIINVTL